MEQIKKKYIPSSFYKDLQFALEVATRCLEATEDENQKIIYKDQKQYTLAFLEGASLKLFYEKCGDNIELLNKVFHHFYFLPTTNYTYKSSDSSEIKILESLISNLKNLNININQSPDIKLAIQQFWEYYLLQIIDNPLKEITTTKGLEIKKIAKQLMIPNGFNLADMAANDIIAAKPYQTSKYLNIQNLFTEMSSFLKTEIEKKVNIIKASPKINKGRENAGEIYTTTILAKIFEEFKITKADSIKLINDLISATINPEISEDTVRKRLKTK